MTGVFCSGHIYKDYFFPVKPPISKQAPHIHKQIINVIMGKIKVLLFLF